MVARSAVGAQDVPGLREGARSSCRGSEEGSEVIAQDYALGTAP